MIRFNDLDARERDVFWGEIAPREHMVQMYDRDEAFLDSLEGFIYGGLQAGEGVLVIAGPAHREALDARLSRRGVDLAAVRAQDQYIALDAAETLARFMVNNWPDEERFGRVVAELVARARGDGRRVRAFGEMVALLWAEGHSGATVNLEHLWHRLCNLNEFSLFCAYPRIGFTQDAEDSLREICAAHSRVLA